MSEAWCVYQMCVSVGALVGCFNSPPPAPSLCAKEAQFFVVIEKEKATTLVVAVIAEHAGRRWSHCVDRRAARATARRYEPERLPVNIDVVIIV